MPTEETNLADELAALYPKRKFKKRNVVDIINKKFVPDGEDENGKAKYKPNPEYGKLVAEYSVVDDSDDGFSNVREVLDLSKTEFLVAKVRVAAEGPYDKEEGRYTYQIPETEEFHNVHIYNDNGLAIYEGPYKAAKKKYDLRFAHALYVYLVKDGVLDSSRLFRFKVSTAHADSWFPTKDLIEKAAQEGRMLTAQVIGITQDRNETTEWNVMKFACGSTIDLTVAVPAIKTARKYVDESSPAGMLPGAAPEVLPPAEKKEVPTVEAPKKN